MANSPEAALQSEIKALYERFGCHVTVLSQRRRFGARGTGQKAGIPDLFIMAPRNGGCWWHETKTADGKQSEAQRDFELRCDDAGVTYVLGGWREACQQLQDVQLIPQGVAL